MLQNRSAWTQFVLVLLVLAAVTLLGGCVGAVKSSETSQPPQLLAISTSSLPGGQVGQPYQGSMVATGGTPPYRWSVASGSLPNGLTISSSSGIIAGQPATSGAFTFTIGVQDSSVGKASAQSKMSMQITAATVATLQISTTSLPNGQVGAAYQSSVVATGGTAPYYWSVATGSLPSGLNINSASGMISGQPATAGTSTFTIGVQDSSANKASARRTSPCTLPP